MELSSRRHSEAADSNEQQNGRRRRRSSLLGGLSPPSIALPSRFSIAGLESFLAARSQNSNSSLPSFSTAKTSSINRLSLVSDAGGTPRPRPERASRQPKLSEWRRYLQSKNPVPPESEEQNWSGRGQHVEFKPEEEALIPLKSERILGYSQTALVDSVRCRRVRLARKTMNCHRRMTRETAVEEVRHLQQLRHSHIVQVVGTYVVGRKFSILLYPAAEYNLQTFMDFIADGGNISSKSAARVSLASFFKCLACTVRFIHSHSTHLTKHMDIKPQNLLVRDMRRSGVSEALREAYRIYIADFGVSRSYSSPGEAGMESPSSLTKLYASPETVRQGRYGLSADIFSLGCVYTEMLAVLASGDGIDKRERLREQRHRNPVGDPSYQANTTKVVRFLESLAGNTIALIDPDDAILRNTIQMLDMDSTRRPTAEQLAEALEERNIYSCLCDMGPEQFETATEN